LHVVDRDGLGRVVGYQLQVLWVGRGQIPGKRIEAGAKRRGLMYCI
jgi:hypothetical protein